MPTLQQVAQRVSQIHALANVSVNSDMRGPLQRAGFKKIHPLYERHPVSLPDGCEVTRYPTTGIDNMLVVRMGGLTILNLNDCNLPARALRYLVRKIGQIDILLANFNHAGKLLEYPSHEQIKEIFKKHFQVVVAAVNPTCVIPFASLHYYRSHGSAHQNGSFLKVEELTGTSSNLIPLAPGDRAIFGPERVAADGVIHIEAHSEALFDWLGNPFGQTHSGWGPILQFSKRHYSRSSYDAGWLTAGKPAGAERPRPDARDAARMGLLRPSSGGDPRHPFGSPLRSRRFTATTMKSAARIAIAPLIFMWFYNRSLCECYGWNENA